MASQFLVLTTFLILVLAYGEGSPKRYGGNQHLRNTRNTKASCDQAIHLGKGGVHKIETPGKGNYTPGTKCSWLLVGTNSCKPQIVCPVAEVRASSDCTGDSITISDGVGGEKKICGKGSFKKPVVASKHGRDLFVTFQASATHKFESPIQGMHCEASCSTGSPADPLPLAAEHRKEDHKCICGLQNKGDRIVGGLDTKRDEVPWQAAIVRTGTRGPICGGSIINNRYILTATHCFYFQKYKPADVEVLIGAHVLDFTILLAEASVNIKLGEIGSMQGSGHNLSHLTDKEDNSQRYKVVEIVNHPLFDPGYDYDVAVLKLDRKIDLTGSSLKPVCLPAVGTYENTYEGEKAVVTGWGLAHELAGATTRLLQKLEVPIIPLGKCQAMMPHNLTDRMICAGYEEGVKDACTGDSGGPLVFKDKSTEQYSQIGIVSWGEGCARAKRPGLFSRVTEFVPWIYHMTNTPGVTWCRSTRQ